MAKGGNRTIIPIELLEDYLIEVPIANRDSFPVAGYIYYIRFNKLFLAFLNSIIGQAQYAIIESRHTDICWCHGSLAMVGGRYKSCI